MAILTASKIDISHITDAQIGACHKFFEGSTPVYKVANSQGKIDDNGDIIEYTVRWNGREKGFSCTCKAAEHGSLCWHIRASIACSAEEREAVAELHRLIAEQALETHIKAAMSDAETVARAEHAKEAPEKVARKRATAPIERKAFSILR
jgi:hypothetical protein